MNERDLHIAAETLMVAAATATEGARNEQGLRHELEIALERSCKLLGIPWTPYQLDRTLFGDDIVRFADVIHGAVIIEYEPPKCFARRENAQLLHARDQAREYSELTSIEEGRAIEEYELVVWDGQTISFGRWNDGNLLWDRPSPFDLGSAKLLLQRMEGKAAPLVSPSALKSYVGLDSAVGRNLVPLLFNAIKKAERRGEGGEGGGRAYLLFREWRRIFGQAVGINTDRLRDLIDRQARAHGADYQSNVPAYLFSLHTYLALVAKLVAALALPAASQDMRDRRVDLRRRIAALEDGQIFEDSGITNMLAGDFFSWPTDESEWDDIRPGVEQLLNALSDMSFDLSRKNPASVRDLFKGIYEVFVPRELRHALGEVYTPDWLAAYVLDRVEWEIEDDLLDPTCGTGTFVLEALKRRLVAANGQRGSAARLLKGLYGLDLNPLAVLGAKASIVVTLSNTFHPDSPVTLPVYLADAINVATPDESGMFRHTIQTELGPRQFAVPGKLAATDQLFRFFNNLRRYVVADFNQEGIWEAVTADLESLDLSDSDQVAIRETIAVLHDLHERGWDGIWCAILADRFAAGAIQNVSHVIGNPPWVKWSNLPPDYAEFIKPLCQALNAFSDDRFVGGIESDISTIITLQAIRKWLAPDGLLAFLITATLFANESSQGFRRLQGDDGRPIGGFQFVEDFKEIAPFDGVTNHPSLMVVRAGMETAYPIPYRLWRFPGRRPRRIDSPESFLRVAEATELLARPVPGTDAGPWLKGTEIEQELWSDLFDAAAESPYRARKGITTDLNGVYFVKTGPVQGARIFVENNPSLGRKPNLPIVRRLIEPLHLFPLARGRGLRRFQAQTDPDHSVIVPQRGMHGDQTLPQTAPATHTFLANFEDWLRARGSYRRYQSSQPYWSTWSTGAYTFAPFKVLWKEMGGRGFAAAYVGSEEGPFGNKVVVPDHKLYFVPLETEREAQYLTAILNARTIAHAVSAYAAQLSLGVSVIEYLKLASFDPANPAHLRLAELAASATLNRGELSEAEEDELDALAIRVVIGN